jgi:nucleotide-binding universal stress UspA family protein
VVVRGEAEERDPAAPVVVGVDGSPLSEAALAFAYEAAVMRKVPLVAVHTWWELILDPHVTSMIDWAALENEEREVLAERLAGWGEKYPDVQVERLVLRDHPGHVLVEQSKRAQLVVVGSRGRGGFTGLVLGSVSHAVLQRAHCPVAVVRPETGETG